MHFSKKCLFALLTLHSLLPTLGAVVWGQTEESSDPESGEEISSPILGEEFANAYRASIQRIDPMDVASLDYGISNVLRNYYRKNFTDSKTWDQLESIRFDGILHLPQGQVRFTAFKKKPDYCKIVIFAGNGGRIVFAYDGSDAWQLSTIPVPAPADAEGSAGASRAALEQPLPTVMPELEALNFIRDATPGGHLLYPLIEGKTITLAGIADVDGQRTYHLRIQLPDGQQIQSFLDMTTFHEIRQITTNNVNGDQEVTTHSDFRQIDGVSLPFTSTLTVDGEQVHQARLYRVQTDLGVMPWMFARPSGAYIPGEARFPLEGNAPSLPPSAVDLKTPLLDKQGWSEDDIWAPSPFITPSHAEGGLTTPSSAGGFIDPTREGVVQQSPNALSTEEIDLPPAK